MLREAKLCGTDVATVGIHSEKRNFPLISITWEKSSSAYLLETETTLQASRTELFDFFSDAFQLEQITPHWLSFRVLTPPPITIRPGTLIDYRLKLHGLPIRWKTEISTWDPPWSFTDRQLKGPYSLWEHLHTFEDTNSGTVVKDQVRYRVPGGALVHSLFVKKDLLRIFGHRLQRMQEIFSSSPAAEPSDHAQAAEVQQHGRQ